MISFDTNLLIYSLNKDCPEYSAARAFFNSLPTAPGQVAICELVLIELYVLLRNPAVLKQPLDAADAVSLVHQFRTHPAWVLIDYPGASSAVMDEVWRVAAQPNMGRRTVFDARLALTLRHHGVTAFATRNESHFTSFGFARVFNPMGQLRSRTLTFLPRFGFDWGNSCSQPLSLTDKSFFLRMFSAGAISPS